jgi:ankyrin repeat protein
MGDLLLKAIQQGNTHLFHNCIRHLQFDYKDYANSIGQTPLTMAAVHRRTDFIRTLLEVRADLAKTDGLGRTAAQIAAEGGDLDSLELLVEAGADKSSIASMSERAAGSLRAVLRWRRRRALCRVREALI